MDLLERLRDRGWRLTAQRRAVADVLRGEHIHYTAESVLERARLQLPELSLATVYNTLNELVEMGEISEVNAGEGPKRYDPNVTETHQHLRCVRCNELLDVRPTGQVTLSAAEQRGYEIIAVDVVFNGLCPQCRAKDDEVSRTAG